MDPTQFLLMCHEGRKKENNINRLANILGTFGTPRRNFPARVRLEVLPMDILPAGFVGLLGPIRLVADWRAGGELKAAACHNSGELLVLPFWNSQRLFARAWPPDRELASQSCHLRNPKFGLQEPLRPQAAERSLGVLVTAADILSATSVTVCRIRSV